MTATTDPSPLSTIGELPDYLLLAQAKQLARHEQALQILVLDHLREIQARRLYLRRGYGSLFDYVVHELDYTAAAAWRRINAMRLCTQTRGARELLRDGSLSLSNAAQLQHAFARDQRSRRQPTYARRAAPGAPGTDNGSTSEPAAAVVVGAGEQQGERGLDAAVKEQLVQQAAGKSTREVTQMLAAVSPDLAEPNDRLRALGEGRWELKAVLDGECQRGLEQLRMLLSHVDPQLTLGKLVGRLVQDGLDRYDPTRTRQRRRTTVRASGTGEQAAETQGAQTTPPRDTSTALRDTSAQKRDTSTASREGQFESAAPAVAARGRDDQSALQRDRELHARHRGATVAEVHNVGCGAAAAAQWSERTADRGRPTSGEQGLPDSTDPGVQRDVQQDAQPAPSRAPARQQPALGDPATSAAKQFERSAYHAPAPVLAPHTGGNGGASAVPSGNCARRTTLPQKPAVPPPGTAAAELRTAPDRDHRATAPRRSAAHERSAAKPGAPSRYIPVAVKREVWRRDQGCCSYVDQRSGRRCGSRYRLQIDHIVPFAFGGDAQPSNLRLRCEAHHRYRHAPRRADGAQGE